MHDGCSQPGCGHCLHCLPVALTYELCDNTRRNQVHEPYQPWWPASNDSPTYYFELKRRALKHQFREQARAGPHGDLAAWRAPHTSTTAGAYNVLSAHRGCRQLGLRLPVARTNLSASEELEFVGCISLEQQQAPVPSQMTQQQEQQQVLLQALQQTLQQQQQHKRQRPRACHPPMPMPHETRQQQQLLLQLDLMSSLHHQEHHHRQQVQQMAATSWLVADAVRPAGFIWPGSCWERPQQHHHHVPEDATRPCSILQPQQECWAFGSSCDSLQPITTVLAAC